MFLFNNKNVVSPLDGKCIPLSDVKDEVFANEMMGPGCAIIPTNGEVVSPIDGKVSVIAPTKHCIGITGNDAAVILFCAFMVKSDLDNYAEWKAENNI